MITMPDLSDLIFDMSQCANAIVRFYVDDHGARQVRVALEDKDQQALVVVTRQVPAGAIDQVAIAQEAMQAAVSEFAAQQRRAKMRAV